MALQIRRGTDAERQLFIPLQGEIIFTTDTKKLYVGDGTTLGGVAVDTVGGGGGADGNTTYSISAELVSGGANLRLTGSDASTDNVKLAAGSNVTISRTNADTITIAATGDGGAVQLNELTDVVITGTPSTGQVLKYDGTNWINGTDATGGGGSATTLDELTDVVITGTPSNGQVLKYNGTNWVNGTDNVGGGGGGATVLDELTDVVITGTPTIGQVLKYNGTDWVNDTDSGGATTLDELDDVFIFGTPVVDQVLKWDGINWINDTVPATTPSVSVEDLTNVTITGGTLIAGQSLVYDGTDWVNDNPSLSLNSLSDVVITTGTFNLQEGMALVYDGTEWVNQRVSIDSLGSVSIDDLTLVDGQTLRYNGISWINSALTLQDLSDVNYGILAPNSVLKWDGTEWIAGPMAVEDDVAPNLGGNLDLNTFDITGTGNVNIIGEVQASVLTSTDLISELGLTIFSAESSQGVTLEGINRPNDPLEIRIHSSRGTLDALVDTIAGDFLGKYSIKGYSQGIYKEGVVVRGRWTADADLTKVYPKSALHFIANNNTNTAPAGVAAAVRGDGVILANVHLATPQTTASINTNYPTPEAGMIVFDSTLQEFKGYVSDTGLAGGGAPNSTPGWITLN
jgi:hypothetical protein